MRASKTVRAVATPRLGELTAADLMTPDPVSIRVEATIPEAVALLTEKGISAAPVIDRAGRPIGVLSRADLVVHDRERFEYLNPVPEAYESDERIEIEKGPGGLAVVDVDTTCVGDIMTPTVFSVEPERLARNVIAEMVTLRVHRLFVIDREGVLIGVISALDILRHLAEE